MATRSLTMTEREKQLKQERDDLYNQYKEKDRELKEYRRTKVSGVLDELNGKYKGKIIRVKLFDFGLHPMNKRERPNDYRIIFVESITDIINEEVQIKGTVLDMFRNSTYLDLANHLSDESLYKADARIYHTTNLRVDPEYITLIDLDKFEGIFTQFDEAIWNMHNKFTDQVKQNSLHGAQNVEYKKRIEEYEKAINENNC